jgi:hypothetical protein
VPSSVEATAGAPSQSDVSGAADVEPSFNTLPPPVPPKGSGWRCFRWIARFRESSSRDSGGGSNCYRSRPQCDAAQRKWVRGGKAACQAEAAAFCVTSRSRGGAQRTACFIEFEDCHSFQQDERAEGSELSECVRFD